MFHTLAQTAPSGSINISYATIAAVVGFTIAAVIVAIKTLTYLSPKVDKLFSNKEHNRNEYLSSRIAHSLIDASEKRPLILHAVMKEVPPELVLRMSTAEGAISRLEIQSVQASELAGQRYEKLIEELGNLRVAIAGQGFRVDHRGNE